MKPAIGLSDSNRNGVIKLLTPLLADEYVLYTKTRNFHWNVVGPQFNDLHKFFEAQYQEIDEFVDEIAERIRQLGGRRARTVPSLSEVPPICSSALRWPAICFAAIGAEKPPAERRVDPAFLALNL